MKKFLKTLIILIIFPFCCWSCKPGKDIPTDVIGMKQMESILLDMQMADVYVNDMQHDSTYQQKRTSHVKTYYKQILQLHRTNKKEFLKSYHFYESRPDLMKEMYDEMEQQVKVEKERVDTTYMPKTDTSLKPKSKL